MSSEVGFSLDKAAAGLRGTMKFVPVTGVDTVVSSPTPNRKGVIIGNTDQNSPVWVAIGQKAAIGSGIQLVAQNSFIQLYFPNSGNIPGLDVHAIASLTGAPAGAQSPFSQIAAQSSTAGAGTNDSFTVPAGQSGVLTSASASNFVGGAPTVALQLTRGGNTITIQSGTGPMNWQAPIALQAADVIKWVTTAGVAATTVDFALSGYTQTLAGAAPSSVNVCVIEFEG